MARRKIEEAKAATQPVESVEFSHEIITPERAVQLLGNNHEAQRSRSESVVLKYLSEMDSGKWRLSPHGIVLNSEGELIDGQHRMEAVRRHGKPVPFIVIRCSSEDVMWAIDRGKSRTQGNLLEMTGRAEKGRGNVTAAICKSLYMFQWSSLHCEEFASVADQILLANKRSIDKVLDLYKNASRTPAAIFAGFVYAYQAYPEFVSGFIRRVRDNDGLEKDTGAWHMRRVLDFRGVRGKDDYVNLVHVTLKCISMDMQGDKVSYFRSLHFRDQERFDQFKHVLFFKKARESVGLKTEVY